MALFNALNDEEAMLQARIMKLNVLLYRKRIRYISIRSRLLLLIALQHNLDNTSRNYSRNLAQNLQAQSDAYQMLAALEGAIRWIEGATENTRAHLSSL